MSHGPSFAVIGAGGFIGSRLVEMLHLDRRLNVRPIVRRASGLALSARFDLEGRVADACDVPALTAALQNCEIVVHATAGDPRSITGSVGTVYRAAEAAGCRRIIYISSAMVLGQSPAPGTDERTPLSRRQPLAYNRAKVIAEETLFAMRRRGRVEAVALRPGIVFGPRSAWIGDFADALLRRQAYLVDGGEGLCNAVYVDNVVHAIERAADTAKADGEAFMIGENGQVSWREFYEPIVHALGREISEVQALGFASAPPSLKDRLDALRLSRPVQAALQSLPGSLRASLGAAWKASGALPEDSPCPAPTLEAALLHRSRYCPPWTKARSMLAYEPIVARDEAYRRTIGWLAFAGYPLHIAAKVRKSA